MLRHSILVLPLAFLAGALFLSCPEEVDAAQTKKPPKTTFKPPAKSAQQGIFRVQARAPYWRAVTIAPNRTVARNIKRTLVRQGWQVQMRANRAGQVAIRARVVSWHTRAVVPNRPAAQRVAYILQSQGLQARIR